MLDLSIAEVPLDWDSFRRLLRDFWSSYKTWLGKLRLPAASAPSAAMGDHNDREYRNGPGIEHLSRERVVVVLVDLKRRIKCDSFIIKEADIDPIRLHHGTKSRLCRDRVQADDRAGPRRLCGGSAPQAGK